MAGFLTVEVAIRKKDSDLDWPPMDESISPEVIQVPPELEDKASTQSPRAH